MSSSPDQKVLIETINSDAKPVQLIEQAEGGSGRIYLEGVAIQGEVQNHNGRIYPRHEIARAVASMQSKIEKFGPVIGECDHPDGLTINLERATHLIENMETRGNDGHARFQIIEAGYGITVVGLIKAGARLGVSSRGSGNVDREGRVSDFDIVTIDLVANPSAPNAYPEPVFESVNRHAAGREAVQLGEWARQDPVAQKHFERAVAKLLNDWNPTRRI